MQETLIKYHLNVPCSFTLVNFYFFLKYMLCFPPPNQFLPFKTQRFTFSKKVAESLPFDKCITMIIFKLLGIVFMIFDS